ncbi:response regulator [Pseudovibrio ascidiaceicola]|jgi:DNA-binding NarL/FixJ family response regulator|uniref:Response regulator transcription factor n=1 Tax=Pseudovibrio brasiliensis TaxID=1898042 RepID=A0ABX8APN1_9HYPH|nr:response regulator transcription factor [Pseudovibrio ascidiaceicola]AEV36264.1 hypothetical protein PSE_1752 [Pseudovibrio sp. FO-BEG1]QUS57050.1 response regulator transcription factor [Pseudovibrio brasiliensis]
MEEHSVHNAVHRFIIADDHPLFRGAMRQTIEKQFASVKIIEAGSLDEVTAALDREEDVDMILLDLSMPGMRGFSGLMYLRAQYVGVPIVVVSGTEDPTTIRSAIEFGASGYIPKSLGIDVIQDGVSVVLEGGVWIPPDIDLNTVDEATKMAQRLASLTPQQVRVLMMLSQGLLNKQIAYELSVSEATVKAHVSAILQKLGVESRTQAVIAAAKIEAGQWQSIAG